MQGHVEPAWGGDHLAVLQAVSLDIGLGLIRGEAARARLAGLAFRLRDNTHQGMLSDLRVTAEGTDLTKHNVVGGVLYGVPADHDPRVWLEDRPG